MHRLRILTASEQVAEHLRGMIFQGQWADEVPGVIRLAQQLAVGKDTVEAAMLQLEREGLLEARGKCRRRVLVRTVGKPRSLRLGILTFDPLPNADAYMVALQGVLAKAGHRAFVAEKSLTELGMNVNRMARMIGKAPADAWVVAAATREVLEWFAGTGLPIMAFFGFSHGLPVATVYPDKHPALRAAVARLVSLGHRRIALIARRMRRLPQPAAFEMAFLDELGASGIVTGIYNLPDWDETPGGLARMLGSLFGTTPPTALIVEESPVFIAVLQFILARRLAVPGDVSLVCTDGNRHFEWCRPSVAHIRWDHRPLVRSVLRWADNVARGKEDRRIRTTKATFVNGGTVGPAPECR